MSGQRIPGKDSWRVFLEVKNDSLSRYLILWSGGPFFLSLHAHISFV